MNFSHHFLVRRYQENLPIYKIFGVLQLLIIIESPLQNHVQPRSLKLLLTHGGETNKIVHVQFHCFVIKAMFGGVLHDVAVVVCLTVPILLGLKGKMNKTRSSSETLLRRQMFPSLAALETRVAETNFAARKQKKMFLPGIKNQFSHPGKT